MRVPDCFIDTNILLYAVSTVPAEAAKTEVARRPPSGWNSGWPIQWCRLTGRWFLKQRHLGIVSKSPILILRFWSLRNDWAVRLSTLRTLATGRSTAKCGYATRFYHHRSAL